MPMGSAIEYDTSALAHEDEGYDKGLKPRQLQMIAIGGAIGTGLFMGAGGRLHTAGPGLFIVYAVCGLFVFFILRALGELVLHRPSSGSFVSYAREFLGEKAAYVAGWMYFFNWACTSIALLGRVRGGTAVDDRVDRAGDRAYRQHDIGETIWGDGVLGRADQGRRVGDVPRRRDHLPDGQIHHRWTEHRSIGHRRQWRHSADRDTATGDHHLWCDLRLCRSRIGRHCGWRN